MLSLASVFLPPINKSATECYQRPPAFFFLGRCFAEAAAGLACRGPAVGSPEEEAVLVAEAEAVAPEPLGVMPAPVALGEPMTGDETGLLASSSVAPAAVAAVEPCVPLPISLFLFFLLPL